MAEFEQNEFGRFITNGLDEKQFTRVFRHIAKLQQKNRKKARRIVTQAMLKTTSVKDLLSLGRKKSDGLFYTLEDMKEIRQQRDAHAKKYGRSIAGITYAELISGCLRVDVDRANNKVSDGRGIERAVLATQKNNLLTIKVKASSVSVHQNHAVSIRLEEWDELLEAAEHSRRGYAKAVKAACAGRVSFNCACGRHQYWYRALATAGNYAVTPPKESAPPKEKNPKYEGLACKHVIKSMVMLQSVTWQALITRQMEQQARSKLPLDGHKEHAFSGEEAKAARRNRKTTVNQDKIKRQHATYTARQQALAKKLARDAASLAKLREQAKKAKKQSEKDRKAAAAAKLAAQKQKAENELLKARLAQKQEAEKALFIKFSKAKGLTDEQAENDYQNYLKMQGKA